MRRYILLFILVCYSVASAQELSGGIFEPRANHFCKIQAQGKTSRTLSILSNQTAVDDSIDVLHYSLQLDINPANEQLTGLVEIDIRSLKNGLSALDLNLVALTVDSVVAGGVQLAFNQSNNLIHIDLNTAINNDDTIQIAVGYHGHPIPEPGNNSWGGFYFDDGNAYNLGVGLNAEYVSMMRHWIPCHDEPWDKASFDLSLTGPLGKTIASIGILESVTPNSQDSTVTYHWIENHQTATYLVALAMYDYVVLEQTLGDTLPVVLYVWPQDSADALIHFEHLPDMIDIYSDLFGPYVFDKVGYAATPKGAMEHQTLISYPGGVIGPSHGRDGLIAHELAHMWWGNWVTVGDWRDIWLNEGFATYSEALFFEHFYDRETYDSYMRDMMSAYFSGIGGEGDFPIYDPEWMWGVHSYQKGGIVLHMLRHLIGDSLFYATLDQYGQTYAFSNATTADFQAQAETVTDENLDWFFQQWIYGPGFPIYEYAWTVDSLAVETFAVTGFVHQARADSLLFDMPMEILFALSGGDSLIEIRMDQAAQGFQLILPDRPATVEIDPGNRILDQHSSVEFIPFAVVDYTINDAISGDGDGNAEPGETAELMIDIKNIAYETDNITAILVSGDAAVTVIDSSGNFGLLAFGEIGSNNSNSYSIEVDAAAELHTAPMELKFYIDGYFAAAIPMGINLYSQQVAFIEGFEFGTAKWDLSADWQPYLWAHSGDLAITDSPTGYYANNSFNPLTCLRTFDLSSHSSASLSFYHIYQFYAGDSGLVQIRQSPEDWHTVTAYSGMSDYNWSQAAVDLTDYCGGGYDNLQLRFVLKSNAADVSDGWYIDDVIFTVDSVITMAVNDFTGTMPTVFKLSQNYPNPFNPVTTIEYHLPIESPVKIIVYNLVGKAVKVLVDEVRAAGIHKLNFDATTMASGMYFYRIETAGFIQNRKMVLLK